MADFNISIGPLLKAEGGYVNHPADRGGPTNWGVTQGALSSWLGRRATIDDVRSLTVDEAKRIYKKRYWDPLWLDQVKSQMVADVAFDQSVNRGPKAAIRNIQESYNRLGGKRISVDGAMGKETLGAMNEAEELDLVLEYIKDAQMDYATIVRSNPSQSVFIRGWIKRTHVLLDKALKYPRKVQDVSTDFVSTFFRWISGLFK